jgi:hypothetical protein
MLVDPAKLFEGKLLYPHPVARERLNRLVGLEDHKKRLANVLGLLVNQAGLRRWASEHHGGAENLLDAVLHRPPLVAGDVGCGKTEIAETIGNAVGRQEGIDVPPFVRRTTMVVRFHFASRPPGRRRLPIT